MERQHEQRAIGRGPAPRLDEGRNLRGDVRVRADRALRPTGGAARVQNERSTFGSDERVAARSLRGFSARRRRELGRRHKPGAGAARERLETLGRRRIGDDCRRLRVLDDVVQLRHWVRERERHRHAASPPDAEQQTDPLDAGRHKESHAHAVEVADVVEPEQRARDAARRSVQFGVRDGRLVGDEGDALRMGRHTRDEGHRSGRQCTPCPICSRWGLAPSRRMAISQDADAGISKIKSSSTGNVSQADCASSASSWPGPQPA